MWAFVQLASAQQATIPFVVHTATAPGAYPDWPYRAAESAIGWTDSGRTLVFGHVTMYSAGGDVINTRCEESGVFALDVAQRTIRELYRFDKPPLSRDQRCMAAFWGSAFSLGRSGELLYGYANRENRVHALDLSSGRETGIGALCDYRVASPRLSADQRSIAVVWGCGHSRGSTLLATMRTDGSHQHILARKDTAGAEDPSWSPDGQWLTYTRNDGTAGEGHPHVAIIDTSGRQLRTLAAGRLPEWSPTGEWIAYEPESPSPSSICLIRPDGKDDHVVVESRKDRQHDWLYGPFRWSPDGHLLAFGRGGLLWQVDIATGAVTQLTSTSGQPEK